MGAKIGEIREVPGPLARTLIEEEKIYGATATQDFNLVVSGVGQGAKIFDVDGNEYLDFCAGVGVINLGHANPAISRVLHDSIDAGVISYDSNVFINPFKVALAKKLSEVTPGNFSKKTFFCNSGTEAVEAALKLCFYNRPERKRFISFQGAFHGRTLGALPLMGAGTFRIKRYPLAYPCHHFPFPREFGALNELKRRLKLDIPPEDVNAIFIELVQGEGGINPIHPLAIKEMVELCQDYNIWLVVDEVQTGFGRTGKLFACEHFGTEPDIVCLAKGMGSGEKTGAIVFRADLDPKDLGWHSNTFGGDPKSSAATLATIEQLLKRGFLTGVSKKGKYLLEKLQKITEDFHRKIAPKKAIHEIRGLGMMVGVEFNGPGFRASVRKQALMRGLILINSGQDNINPTLRFMPPLIITKEEINIALGILKESLEASYELL